MTRRRIAIGAALAVVTAGVFCGSWRLSHPPTTTQAVYVAPQLGETSLTSVKPAKVAFAPTISLPKAHKPPHKPSPSTSAAAVASTSVSGSGAGVTLGATSGSTERASQGTGASKTAKSTHKSSSVPQYGPESDPVS